MADEWMDEVDQHDCVIGRKLRSDLYAENSSNCRAINAFLVNEQGQLWIPRRTAGKQLFPLHLDMSCAGHVRSGESYDDALRREVREEINVLLDAVSWRCLGHLSPYEDGVSMFMKVYEIRSEKTPQWTPEDFVEAYWIAPGDLLTWIQTGEPAKGDLSLLVKKFY